MAEAAEKIFLEDVIERNSVNEGFNFRNEYMFTLKCDEIFKKNESNITKLFESYFNEKKKFITIADCESLIIKAGI